MNTKQIILFILLGSLITYLFFFYVRQNERLATCTRLYSQCTITNIKYLMLGGIDVTYVYWVGGKTVSVKWKVSDAEIKPLVNQIKVGDTLSLLYCKEYPNLNTPIINSRYLNPSGW